MTSPPCVSKNQTKSLIPAPLPLMTLSPQSLLLAARSPGSRHGCPFHLNLDIKCFLEDLCEDERTDISERAHHLQAGARENQRLRSSEFRWEADAWRDVFDLIRIDATLRMSFTLSHLNSYKLCLRWKTNSQCRDKRPYGYIERNNNDDVILKRRIPDATMALRSYDNASLNHSRSYDQTTCKWKDHEPHESLSKERILKQMRDAECGLVVDGVWGEASVIFPFAVYEAKNRNTTSRQAENQIQHACRTYLGMLDHLARDPRDVSKYQTTESQRYEVFGFTSCGPEWEVYVAWPHLDHCHMQTLWRGDVRRFSNAIELICIVDQVHDYAATRHRDFVIDHLEPWLRHAELHQAAFSRRKRDHQPPRPPKRRESLQPEWIRVKSASNDAKRAKSALTRERTKRKREENDVARKKSVIAISAEYTQETHATKSAMTP